MAGKRDPQRKTKHRARVFGAVDARPAGVPLWWVTSVAGIFLLPVAVALTRTFLESFACDTVRHGLWMREEFWFFALGGALMALAFFGLPKPVRIYVFGHELTHAIWVWMCGGRVSADWKADADGGYILASKQNLWIALAPYFYPIYSILLFVVYGFASLFADLAAYHAIFLGLLGATWAFHVCFTLWMIPKGQTDLSYYGTFFSLVVIYLANFLILSAMLVAASPHTTAAGFCRRFLAHLGEAAAWIWHLAH